VTQKDELGKQTPAGEVELNEVILKNDNTSKPTENLKDLFEELEFSLKMQKRFDKSRWTAIKKNIARSIDLHKDGLNKWKMLNSGELQKQDKFDLGYAALQGKADEIISLLKCRGSSFVDAKDYELAIKLIKITVVEIAREREFLIEDKKGSPGKRSSPERVDSDFTDTLAYEIFNLISGICDSPEEALAASEPFFVFFESGSAKGEWDKGKVKRRVKNFRKKLLAGTLQPTVHPSNFFNLLLWFASRPPKKRPKKK
jgi:hypothetical protein